MIATWVHIRWETQDQQTEKLPSSLSTSTQTMMMMRKTVKTNRHTTSNLLDNKVNVSICFHIHVKHIYSYLYTPYTQQTTSQQGGRITEALTQIQKCPYRIRRIIKMHTLEMKIFTILKLQIVIVTQIRANAWLNNRNSIINLNWNWIVCDGAANRVFIICICSTNWER